MFTWLYRLLFARRVKWVAIYQHEDGSRSRTRICLYDPTPEDIAQTEEKTIQPLEESGWTVLTRPRP